MQPDSMYAKRHNNDENLNRILKKTPRDHCYRALPFPGGGRSGGLPFYTDFMLTCLISVISRTKGPLSILLLGAAMLSTTK